MILLYSFMIPSPSNCLSIREITTRVVPSSLAICWCDISTVVDWFLEALSCKYSSSLLSICSNVILSNVLSSSSYLLRNVFNTKLFQQGNSFCHSAIKWLGTIRQIVSSTATACEGLSLLKKHADKDIKHV